jgi:hypothetical protein
MKRRMIVIGALLLCAAFVGACGASAPKLDLKIGGKDSTLNVKTTGTYYGNVINTSPGKPAVQTFCHQIYLANYDMDTTSPVTMRKPLTAPDQVRVELELTGEEGTKDASPFKVGTYSVSSDMLNRVRSIDVTTFVDGKEKRTSFETMMSTRKTAGEVKITAVTADSITGEVNLTEGDNSIKGTFTAKLPKAK